MIPFNHLGWVFNYFGPIIYPRKIRDSLCIFVKSLKRSASILDLGAGTGVMSEFAYAYRDDLKFTAVDPAEGMLAYSAEYIKTHKAYAEALPFDADSFEAILIGEALHHFDDVEKSLEEIVRVLKHEGKVFIYDFDSSTMMGNTLCRVERLFGEPGNFFVPGRLKKLLENYGFSVEVNHFGWRYTISAVLERSSQ